MSRSLMFLGVGGAGVEEDGNNNLHNENLPQL